MVNTVAVDEPLSLNEACTEIEAVSAEIEPVPPVRGFSPAKIVIRGARGIMSAAEWMFGIVSLVLGLSMLAALPLVQFLSLGYLLESSARVARTGRIRDGLIGVRLAARVGGLAAGIWLSLVPAWLVGIRARSAELIDPGGPIARRWQMATRGRDLALASAYRTRLCPRGSGPALPLAV